MKIAAEKIGPEVLMGAYASGYFPMADSREGEIGWYSPDPRAIIPFDSLKISRSLNQTIRKKIFELRIDTQFERVMRSCAGRDDTWISESIVQSYLQLYDLGFAHSVETWKDGELAGGLYGVTLGAAFFGESMFSSCRDASKVALVFLADILVRSKFELLDTQFMTPHLKRMGAIEISRQAYLEILKPALRKERKFAL